MRHIEQNVGAARARISKAVDRGSPARGNLDANFVPGKRNSVIRYAAAFVCPAGSVISMFNRSCRRLHEYVSVLRSAASSTHVGLAKPLYVALRLPSGVRGAVVNVGTGLDHSEGQTRTRNGVPIAVNANERIDAPAYAGRAGEALRCR